MLTPAEGQEVCCSTPFLSLSLCRLQRPPIPHLLSPKKGVFPEIENIGLLWAKHRNFRGKSTALLCKEVRCFGFSGRKTPVLWPKKNVKVLMPRFCDISERVRTWWLPMAFSGR